MRTVIFCHSLISDWNHGNAHFLRGIAAELQARGHEVIAYEPADGWSRHQLLADAGPSAIAAFHQRFPRLSSVPVDLEHVDLDEVLDGADLVLVHEWNPHALVRRIGRHKARRGRYVLLFHDTHHRSVTDAEAMARYRLDEYDGVLAFGEVIRQRYLRQGWGRRAWTWHEAADTTVFKPLPAPDSRDDLVWIGNWGDDERTVELRSYLIDSVRALGLHATVHGVRYPDPARQALAEAGISYGGWLPNHEAPDVYARHLMTVHIPRRPYVRSLPGIPTIRVFEALACGVPLASAAWQDVKGLFTPGADYLVASSPEEMRSHLRALVNDADLRGALAGSGLHTIRRRHTCAHRVDELLKIVQNIRSGTTDEAVAV
jgi:spore maturation protein CgeB